MKKNIKKQMLSIAGKTLLSAALLGPVTIPYGLNQVEAATTVAQGDQIASYALSFKGTPFKEGGATPNGFDGPGFVYYVYQKQGIELPRSLDRLINTGESLSPSQVRPGDLVFVKENNSEKIEHVGIYLGNYQFIVAAKATGGVKIHSFRDPDLRARYAGARHISSESGDAGTALPVSGKLSSPQQAIINTLKGTIGKPYSEGADGPNSFDAEGLVEFTYEQNGMAMPETLAEMAKKGVYVGRTSLEEGDVVFLGTSRTNILSAAVYVGDNRIALASKDIGEVVVRELEGIYENYYLGARRLLGNESQVTQPVDKPGQSEQTSDAEALADAIIATGEKYLGTPYKLGAEYPTSGMFDCSSFTQLVYAKNGIKLPRSSRQQVTVGEYVPLDQLKKGDLIFTTRSGSGGKIGHVGIYAGNGMMLHTWGPGGVRYDKFEGSWMEKRYVTARRVINY